MLVPIRCDAGRSIHIEVSDLGTLGGLAALAGTAANFAESEDYDDHEKNADVAGQKVHESWKNATEHSGLPSIVDSRFAVGVTGDGVEMDTALKALETIDVEESRDLATQTSMSRRWRIRRVRTSIYRRQSFPRGVHSGSAARRRRPGMRFKLRSCHGGQGRYRLARWTPQKTEVRSRRFREAVVVKLQKVCIAEKLASFEELWSPKTLAVFDDYAIKAVKLEGPFVWHDHPENDEIFYVLRGAISMEYRSDGVEFVERFGPGELLRIPKGVAHRPVADPGTEMLLFERESLVNTGEVVSERTRVAERI